MKKLNFFNIILALLFLLTFYSNPVTTTPIPCIITSVSAESNKSSQNNSGNKSFKERMCSTITDFLEDKITTTKKGSTTSNILQGSLKEVNGLCDKGIVPQVSEIKGLSPKDKEILNKKTENALKKFYDGAGNLPDEDFDGTKLKSSKTGSGTSGTRLSGDKVSDLKSSDPTLLAAKANPVPSLKTTKAQSLSNNSKGQLPPCPGIPVPCPMSDGVQLYCTKPCYGYYDSLYSEGCLPGGCVYKPKPQPCPEGQVLKPDGTCGCPQGQILLEGKCKPKPGIVDKIKEFFANIKKKIEDYLKERKEKKDAKAIAEWKERSKNSPTAYTVCDGKGGFKPKLNKYENAPCGVEECVRIHEQTHINDFKGNETYKNWCVGVTKDTVVGLPENDPFRINSECNAFTALSNCLKTKKSKNPSSACKTLLTEEYNDSQWNVLKFCKF